MDLDEAILFGQLVNAAYAVAPDNLTNRAGEIVPAGLDGNQTTTRFSPPSTPTISLPT
jgi:hypothetical protein